MAEEKANPFFQTAKWLGNTYKQAKEKVTDKVNKIKENKANYNAEENKKLNSTLESAQKGRADESKRLATTSKAVEEKISPAEAANKTGENLAETQKTITAPNDVTNKAEEVIAEQKELNKQGAQQPVVEQPQPESVPLSKEEMAQVQQEVQSLGIDEGSSDEDVKNAVADLAIKYGLAEVSRDGQLRFRQYDSKASSIMRGVGTALSVLLSYLSGGSLPPMNFYNIRSANDAKAKEQYDSLMDHLNEVMQGLYGTDITAEYQKENADKSKAVGEYKTATEGGERAFEQQKEIININFENAKEMANFQNELTKNLIKYKADVDAAQLVREIKSLKESGLSQQEIATWIQRTHGQTAANAAADTIGKYVGIGANAVGTAVGAATGLKSDKKVKEFKKQSRTYNYVKGR